VTRRSRLCAASVAIGVVLGAVAAFVAADAAPAESPAAGGTVAEPGAPPVLTVGGFRSARWGMDEAEIKAAIQKDFGAPASNVSTTVNAVERTTVLTVMVRDLLEGAGTAQISYILGYKSKKLIQVTLLWGTPVDPRVPAENIVTAANQLRQLFLDSGYEPKTIIANARLVDGSILVFEGEDAAKHTTLLRLASTPSAANGSQKKGGITSIALSLSYVLDSQHPDIFSLKKGQF
jgi:hypothetical protein